MLQGLPEFPLGHQLPARRDDTSDFGELLWYKNQQMAQLIEFSSRTKQVQTILFHNFDCKLGTQKKLVTSLRPKVLSKPLLEAQPYSILQLVGLILNQSDTKQSASITPLWSARTGPRARGLTNVQAPASGARTNLQLHVLASLA